jgi:hypothetical protein
MLKFWLYQEEQARQKYAACENKIYACKRANERTKESWQSNNEDFGLGYGPILPFDGHYIASYEKELPLLKAEYEEAKCMAGYMINYITDRAHPEQQT